MQYSKRIIPVVGAVALLATAGVGVAAQDAPAELSTPAYVTWTSGEPASIDEGTFDPETGQLRGVRIDGIPLESTDPRLTGLASVAINGNGQRSGDTRAVLEVRSYRIVNDEGAWTGSATYIEAGDISGDEFVASIVQESGMLVGEGAYEGLIFVGGSDYLEANNQGEGVIYEMSTPPTPDVPEMATK